MVISGLIQPRLGASWRLAANGAAPPTAQVFSLKNGNRERDGRAQAAGAAAPLAGVMSYSVDLDKASLGGSLRVFWLLRRCEHCC